MTLLITGATGLVGCHLVESLVARRSALGAPSRLRLAVRPGRHESGRARLEALLQGDALEALRRGDLEVVAADLAAPLEELERTLGQGLEGIVHLAARTDFSADDVEGYRPVNVEGARRIAELAARVGCPLVHVSTAYVAGNTAGTFTEADLDRGQAPNNAYEQSKLEGEQAVRAVCAQHDVPLTVFRPGVVLPDRPRAGTACRPGPIVYLQLLATLDARATGGPHTVRFAGTADARLSLVPLEFVVRILAEAVERLPDLGGTYHLTAGHTFRIAELRDAVNGHLDRLRTAVCRAEEIADPGLSERWMQRRCAHYGPYLDLRTVHDRARLLRDFDGDDGADAAWLDRVCAGHLEYWRQRSAERSAARRPVSDEQHVGRYFGGFLADKQGVVLVPGLKSLSADFTVSVPEAGIHRLSIEEGRLTAVEPVEERAKTFDFELDAAAFLAVAAGRTKPSQLFFARRIRVRGNLFKALSTATALEEFFRLYPYAGAQPRECVS